MLSGDYTLNQVRTMHDVETDANYIVPAAKKLVILKTCGIFKNVATHDWRNWYATSTVDSAVLTGTGSRELSRFQTAQGIEQTVFITIQAGLYVNIGAHPDAALSALAVEVDA